MQTGVCERRGAEDTCAWPREKLPARSCYKGRQTALPCEPQECRNCGAPKANKKVLRYAGCDRCAGGAQGASAERSSVA
eukprot:5506017-Alexandrium_andersonii.AAC.1